MNFLLKSEKATATRGLSWCWGAPVAAISPRTHPAGMVTAFRFIVLSYVAGKNYVGTPKITAFFDDFWIGCWCLLKFIEVYWCLLLVSQILQPICLDKTWWNRCTAAQETHRTCSDCRCERKSDHSSQQRNLNLWSCPKRVEKDEQPRKTIFADYTSA
jgi:hypothetical protein